MLVTEKPNTFQTRDNCFICGELLIFPFVFWQGTDGESISLHPNCAEYLSINLLSDFLGIPATDTREEVRHGNRR